MIEANIIAHSSSPFGEELITFEVTFPKIILPEVLTHRMFSRNTSSSRAIPFKKMIEAVKENPFIPYAWQKDHKGMQGDKYITDETTISRLNTEWLRGRDKAVEYATYLHDLGLTKQLCNRLLDPYIWTRMIITTTTYGLENFFKLRAPKYRYVDVKGNKTYFTTRTEWWEAQSQSAIVMHGEDFESFIKGKLQYLNYEEMMDGEATELDEPLCKYKGWCNNFKGFIPYRYIIENKLDVRNYGEA